MGSLQKDIILNGSESLAVFKDAGVVYRAADIASYTPIVFRNLKANTAHYFDLQSVISKDYRVVDAVSNLVEDDEIEATQTAEIIQLTYSGVFLSTYRNNKRQSVRQFAPTGGQTFGQLFPISPLDKISIVCGRESHSVTLYCQPVYLENTIVVPEVMLDDSNNSGNENPSPEPVIE